MITLPGYLVDTLLYESRQSRIYRGSRQSDRLPVILKVLNEDSPSSEKRARFLQEYQLMCKVESEAIVAIYGLESHQGSHILIVEDFGGTSLNHLDFCKSLLLHQWLDLAIRIAHALAELHRHHIMHKDINPANIVWNCDTGQVKLIDLGIATELTREVPEIRNPDRLEGTLAYLSPEQTGRMNRSMDYRTDFYSLGVTFYELLTGQTPFASTDALELVHAHIARQPTPIDQIRPGIPSMVAAIITKLMGKTAEERYQSATGLQADLQTCLQLLDGGGRIAPFALGSKDFSGRLHISQKLYGRAPQIATLLNVYDRVSRGPAELLLVAGYSGVGKSALVHEIQKPITRNRGIFIEGKFDQFKRDIPYASVSQAFKELMQQVLTQGDEEVAAWKERLLQSLGNKAQVIIEVIPALEQIIGPQPPIIELPATQAQNRFNHEFRNFVGMVATAEHPLVLFLDDLQWADLPSLQLMSLLLRAPAIPHLLLIGAYRDNEITPTHPLRLSLNDLEKAEAAVHTIILAPLGIDDVNELLCDTLHASPVQFADVAELAQLSLTKTEGNPFFLNQFLSALVDQKILSPNLDKGGWQWDIGSVHRAGITDNIVDLMVTKLYQLPESTQQILQGAACLGNTFDLRMLAGVCRLSEADTARRLWPALQVAVIIPLDNRYRYAEQPDSAGESSLTPSYRFLHDRVHQAANLLSGDAEKAAMHLAIGRLWLASYSADEQQELLFDLVNHLNHGCDLMTDPAERGHVAQLNLTAARRAKASVAYKPALMYLQTALSLLDEADWQRQYELTFAVHVEGAEAAYLNADMTTMDRYLEIALRQAKDLLDQVKVHEIRIQAFITQDKYREAVASGLAVLRLLGVTFPKNPTKLHVMLSVFQTKLALAGKSMQALEQLPYTSDARILAAKNILTKISSAAYYTMPKPYLLLRLKAVRLMLEHGHSRPTSASDFGSYSMIVGGMLGDIKQGAQFGDLALRMLEHPDMQVSRSRIMYTLYAGVRPWTNPLHETLEPLKQAFLHGVELGDVQFASNAAHVRCLHAFYCGVDLLDIERETDAYLQSMVWPSVHFALTALRQSCRSLIGHPATQNAPQGWIDGTTSTQHANANVATYDDDELPALDSKSNTFAILTTRLICRYLFHDYRGALKNIVRAEPYAPEVVAFIGGPVFYFYSSLTRLALLDSVATTERIAFLRKIKSNQKKLRFWARHAPDNFLHKWQLVDAELAAQSGKQVEAIHGYENAIRLARKHNFLQEEALSKELAGEYFLKIGIESIAKMYLGQAQQGYRRWGALAKVNDMAARYPDWLGEQMPVMQTSLTNPREMVSMTGASSLDLLDFATVMKAAQAVSKEIVLTRLLKRLMHVVIESAGAQRGLLLLKKDQRWFVEAEKLEGQADADVLQAVALDALSPDDTPLPLSLVHYTAHTKESIVVDEALSEKLVAADPYVLQHRPRALLIMPILHQGELTGMLYLENNAMSGAFNARRLELLQLLASQAAISIENARLYAAMEQKVAIGTAEMQAMSHWDGPAGIEHVVDRDD